MYGSWVLLLILFLSSLPVIAVYVWYRIAKYPFTLVQFLFALLAGAAGFFPALILQDLLNFSFAERGRMEMFYHVFVRIAFTEEFSRLLMLFIFFWISNRLASGENPLSFNVLKKATATGLVAGLGFALLESAVYASADTSVLILRAVTAAPLHAACGSRIGAAAVLLRTNPFQAFLRILTATAIHGIYNFMVIIPGFPSVMAILIALSAFASSVLVIRGSWTEPAEDTSNP